MRAWTAIGAPSLLADEAAVALMLRRCVPADGMRARARVRVRARSCCAGVCRLTACARACECARASERALSVQFRIEQLCGA
jgi:hypothetical protein